MIRRAIARRVDRLPWNHPLRRRLRYVWILLQQDGAWWLAAELADKLPRQCWSDLVDWALIPKHRREGELEREDLRLRDWLPYRPQTDGCRRDRDRVGSCYCGKIRAPEPAS